LDTTLAKTESYLYGNYVLEKVYSVRAQSYINKNAHTHNSSTISQIPQNYILTDLSKKQCVEISLSDTPTITSKYPLISKGHGIKLFGDISELKNEIPHFKFEKDTIINDEKYAILKDVSNFKMGEGYTVKEVVILLNLQRKNFPIHLVSESLDKKFKGSITNLCFYFENNYKTEVISSIDHNISKQERLLLNKCIDLYTQSLDKHR
jgi:hypothetical protein